MMEDAILMLMVIGDFVAPIKALEGGSSKATQQAAAAGSQVTPSREHAHVCRLERPG